MRQKNGFSLLELLLVFGILAAVSAGVFWLFGKASQERNLTAATNDIYGLIAEIRTQYAFNHNYRGLNTTVAANFDLPQSLTWNGQTMGIKGTNAVITIAGINAHTPQGPGMLAFTVNITNLTARECNHLATGLLGGAWLLGTNPNPSGTNITNGKKSGGQINSTASHIGCGNSDQPSATILSRWR